MPAPTTIMARLAYAAICGILMFLAALGVGLLVIHFLVTPDGISYGTTIKNLAVVLGILTAIVVFFSGWTWSHHPHA